MPTSIQVVSVLIMAVMGGIGKMGKKVVWAKAFDMVDRARTDEAFAATTHGG